MYYRKFFVTEELAYPVVKPLQGILEELAVDVIVA